MPRHTEALALSSSSDEDLLDYDPALVEGDWTALNLESMQSIPFSEVSHAEYGSSHSTFLRSEMSGTLGNSYGTSRPNLRDYFAKKRAGEQAAKKQMRNSVSVLDEGVGSHKPPLHHNGGAEANDKSNSVHNDLNQRRLSKIQNPTSEELFTLVQRELSKESVEACSPVATITRGQARIKRIQTDSTETNAPAESVPAKMPPLANSSAMGDKSTSIPSATSEDDKTKHNPLVGFYTMTDPRRPSLEQVEERNLFVFPKMKVLHDSPREGSLMDLPSHSKKPTRPKRRVKSSGHSRASIMTYVSTEDESGAPSTALARPKSSGSKTATFAFTSSSPDQGSVELPAKRAGTASITSPPSSSMRCSTVPPNAVKSPNDAAVEMEKEDAAASGENKTQMHDSPAVMSVPPLTKNLIRAVASTDAKPTDANTGVKKAAASSPPKTTVRSPAKRGSRRSSVLDVVKAVNEKKGISSPASKAKEDASLASVKSGSFSKGDVNEERLIDFVKSVSDPEVLHVIYDYLCEKPELRTFEQLRSICNELLDNKEQLLNGKRNSSSNNSQPRMNPRLEETAVGFGDDCNSSNEEEEEVASEDDEFEDYDCSNTPYPYDTKFQFGEPSVSGFVSKVFKEGMLYRIIDDKGDYYFYNDTIRHIMMVRVRYTLKGTERVNERAIVSDAKDGREGEKEIAIAVLPEETNFMIGGIAGRLPSVSAKAVQTPDDFISSSVKRSISTVNEGIAAARKALGQWEKATDQTALLKCCVKKKVRFTDLNFRPCAKSLYRPEIDLVKVPNLTWLRPEHYLYLTEVGAARLFRGEISCHLVRQGELLNHTVIASIAAVALFPDHVRWMFRHPLSAHNGKQERAVGAYTVRLLRNGWWTTIYVDSYLPACMKGPLFARCPADPRRLWVSLLEKAYAKCLGSYSSTCLADLMETIGSFTGYPFRYITAFWQAANKDASENESKKLFVYLQKCLAAGFLIPIFTPTVEEGHKDETELLRRRSTRFLPVNGVMPQFLAGHVYFITDAALYKELDLRMVRLKNPWTWESQRNAQAERVKRWKYTAWYDQPDMSISMGSASLRMATTLAGQKMGNDERKGTMWMQWSEALRAFEGGGVCYTAWNWHQYRMRGSFMGGYPILGLEIVAHTKVEGYLTLTMKSIQDLFDENGNVTNSFVTRGEMCPVTLLVARACVGQKDQFEVAGRACEDIECLAGKPTFVKARDVSIKASFTKSKQPYYVIPQMDMSYLRRHPSSTDIPFVLSFLSDKPVGLGDLEVRFKIINPTCKVFQNADKFTLGSTETIEADYQLRGKSGFTEEKGSCIVDHVFKDESSAVDTPQT